MNRTRASEVGAFGYRDQRNRLSPTLVGNAYRAGEFIRGALAKTDHLDIVVVGDSNTAYEDDPTLARGYAGAFFDYAISNSSYIYTTGQFYTAGSVTTYPTNGGPTSASGTIYHESSLITRLIYATPTNGGYWYNGAVTSYPKPDGLDIPVSYVKPYFYNEGTSRLWMGTVGSGSANCCYFHDTSGGSNSYAGTWVKLYHRDPTIALSSRDAVTYRTYHGKIPGAGATAKYTSWVYNAVGGTGTPAAQTSVSMTNAGTETVISFDDRDCAARADANVIAGTFTSNNTASGTVGPMAVFFHTFFKKNAPGFGISVMQRAGGGTTTQIASAFGDREVGTGLATQKLYLDCIRKTQIAAGGKGRVLVFINMGTNGAATGPTYYQDTARIIQQLKTAWGQTGAPADDLVFVVSASHQWSSFNPDSASAAAKALESTEANVVAFDFSKDFGINQTYLSANNRYPNNTSTSAAHLSKNGYNDIVSAMITALRRL